jgi:hypothetical protein
MIVRYSRQTSVLEAIIFGALAIQGDIRLLLRLIHSGLEGGCDSPYTQERDMQQTWNLFVQ